MEHLLTVVCGLDSMVVGEEQIVAQVRDALRLATEHKAIDHVLGTLVRSSLRVSKRARTVARLGNISSSLVEVGLRRAAESLGGLRDHSGLIVGAGRMGSLTGSLMRNAGIRTIVVTSRTEQHATRLAEQIGGVSVALEGLPGAVSASDLVVSSTGAPGYVLTADHVVIAMRGRPDRPLFLLDLAMPRDIEPDARLVPGVTLVGMEALGEWLRAQEQRDDIAAVREVVSQGAAEFLTWRQTTEVASVVGALRAQADHLVDTEVRRLHDRLPGLDQRAQLETRVAVRRAVSKLLHTPTVRVKELPIGLNGLTYLEALAALFDLDPIEVAS